MASRKTAKPPTRKKPRRKPPGEDPPVVTVVRPLCPCETTKEIYTGIGTLPPTGRPPRPRQIKVTVSSKVDCDEARPDHCRYTYTAAAVVEQRVPRRGQRPARWVRDRRRRAFIASFTVKDDVNSTEKPDRVDQTTLSIEDYFELAPQKEKTEIVLVLAASGRVDWTKTITRRLELCVPKLDNPKCP